LFDADVPPAVAVGLPKLGHDVVAASGDTSLGALDDAALLRMAAQQQRVLVTFNISDFVELARTYADAREDHAGMVLIHAGSFRRTEIGAIVTALDDLLTPRRDFANVVLFLKRPAP
jgi:predicted nuclease of predicted toxin-antitoxin system